MIARLEDRKKQKTQRKDRKSVASQNRMKTIANLAAEEKVSKKRKKGDGKCSFNHPSCGPAGSKLTMIDDDGFGRNDDDWAVYREVVSCIIPETRPGQAEH